MINQKKVGSDMTVAIDSLLTLLNQMDSDQTAAAQRGATWASVSDSVTSHLSAICSGVANHPVVSRTKLYAEKENASGAVAAVTLRFGHTPIPLRHRSAQSVEIGVQRGASLWFVPTLSGHIRVTAVGFSLEFRDETIVQPTERLLDTVDPTELGAMERVLDFTRAFFELAAETHWPRRNKVEML